MKRGFTLAELLITLGIIAVISALLAVAIAKLRPDKDKVAFLKQYDAVMNVTNEMVNNSRLYPICQTTDNDNGDPNLDCREHPLFNIAATKVGGETVSGSAKYCDLLTMMLSGKKIADNSCTLNPTYADGAWTPTFVTKNGNEWLVSTNRSAAVDAENIYNATYQTDIYIDINGAKGPNCLYNKDTCKSPDRFKLLVASDGTIIAADPMGQAYINTRKNWNKKELDIAEDSAVVADLNSNLRNFQLNTCGAVQNESHQCPAGTTWNAATEACEEENTNLSDDNCPDGQSSFNLPGWEGCYPPAILIESEPSLAEYSGGITFYVYDWKLHVWTNSNAENDIYVFIGFINDNGTRVNNDPQTAWKDVPFEIGCKIPSGGNECKLDVTSEFKNAYPGAPTTSSTSTSFYNYYKFFSPYMNEALPANKINSGSNQWNSILRSYGQSRVYIKITTDETQQREIGSYGNWDGTIKGQGSFSTHPDLVLNYSHK